MFLNFTLACAVDSEAGIVLSLFLIFTDFEPRCSYKIVLIKKKVYSFDVLTSICARSHYRMDKFQISVMIIEVVGGDGPSLPAGNVLLKNRPTETERF